MKCQLSPFSYPKKRKIKWKRLNIQFVNTADSYDIYTVAEFDMGPELPTAAAADQNFVWIRNQLQDQLVWYNVDI